VSQHEAQQGLGCMGLHRRRGEDPAPTPVRFKPDGLRAASRLRSLDAAAGASPRTQRSAAGSPGHHGLRSRRSIAPDL